MKKLLQATSAVSLILMSSQAFASNAQNYDDEAIAQVWAACAQMGMSDEDINAMIAEQFSNNRQEVEQPAAMPVALAHQPSVVSTAVAPVPAIEEVVQDIFIPMATLAQPGTDHNIFEAIYTDVHAKIFARTGAGSKDYSIIEFINKIKAQRLYDPVSWNGFQKRAFAHDPNDINMVSREQQITNIQAIFYKSFYASTQKKITELHAVGSVDPRSVDEIIYSMSNKGTANPTQSTPFQGAVNGFMGWKKDDFRF